MIDLSDDFLSMMGLTVAVAQPEVQEADSMSFLAPTQADAFTAPQEAASAAPVLAQEGVDFMYAPMPQEAASAAAVADDFTTTTPTPAARSVGVPHALVGLKIIAARRAALEDELRSLYLQYDSNSFLLERGLIAECHKGVQRALVQRFDGKTFAWRWTETEAWRWALERDLVPYMRTADWSPFSLLESHSK